jgi:hypothetical protein
MVNRHAHTRWARYPEGIYDANRHNCRYAETWWQARAAPDRLDGVIRTLARPMAVLRLSSPGVVGVLVALSLGGFERHLLADL